MWRPGFEEFSSAEPPRLTFKLVGGAWTGGYPRGTRSRWIYEEQCPVVPNLPTSPRLNIVGSPCLSFHDAGRRDQQLGVIGIGRHVRVSDGGPRPKVVREGWADVRTLCHTRLYLGRRWVVLLVKTRILYLLVKTRVLYFSSNFFFLMKFEFHLIPHSFKSQNSAGPLFIFVDAPTIFSSALLLSTSYRSTASLPLPFLGNLPVRGRTTPHSRFPHPHGTAHPVRAPEKQWHSFV